MKALLVLLFVAILGASIAQDCNPGDCKEPDCVCASIDAPIENPPQLVTLTFDDSLNVVLYNNTYRPLLFDRLNPDGEHISATFFIPHIYTDYIAVNDLYNRGFEIAVNSISKNPLTSYWIQATVPELVEEFGGQRTIISHFANIPIDTIEGVRCPNFAINGDTTYEAYVASGLKYDNSWPTPSARPLYSYTLDFESPQQCMVASCPVSPFPGFWEMPIVNFLNPEGVECNALLSCINDAPVDDIFNWLKAQFDRTYNGNRASLNILASSAWLGPELTTVNSQAFIRFLDYLATLPDVFLVSEKQVINWRANPVPAEEFSSAQTIEPTECTTNVYCALQFNDEVRYMGSCVDCPAVYPWLGNPLGEAPEEQK